MNHRWLARGFVAALHLALLVMLWQHRPPSPAGISERRLTAVRLITIRPRPLPQPPPLPAARRQVSPDRPSIAPLPFDTEAAAPVAVTPPADATAPAESPRPALRLTLPPGYAASSAAARNPALDDPRSHTPRRSLEDRIADAAAVTGDWVAERTSDQRTLLRRGDTCVEVLRSRIADQDRFNENIAPRAVSMLGKPYKCK